jgi:DNA-binding transcriptional MerR regulator
MDDPETGAVQVPEEIPDKLYFRIGEVSRLAGIKPYVLRFWESEFHGLGPKKSGTGHRLYRRKDVEMVLEIKRLLYDKRFTIEGARKILADKHRVDIAKVVEPEPTQQPLFNNAAALDEIRKELRAILKMLK